MSLGWTLHWKQDAAGSLAAMKKGLSLDPHPWNAGSLGYLHAVAGDHEQAEQTLRDLELLAEQRYVTPAARMVVYLGLDDKEQALDWLEKCLADRDLQCWFLGVDPVYDRLRDEPRFKAVLKKVGLDN